MRYESGGETFVAMMQAADFRDSDHLSDLAWHNRAGVGAILAERKMRASSLVIVDVGGQRAAQMALTEDHDMIQALAANRTYDALDVGVLPGRTWRGSDFHDPHRLDPVAELRAVRRVAIAKQVARSSVPRECFSYLAR